LKFDDCAQSSLSQQTNAVLVANLFVLALVIPLQSILLLSPVHLSSPPQKKIGGALHCSCRRAPETLDTPLLHESTPAAAAAAAGAGDLDISATDGRADLHAAAADRIKRDRLIRIHLPRYFIFYDCFGRRASASFLRSAEKDETPGDHAGVTAYSTCVSAQSATPTLRTIPQTLLIVRIAALDR